MSLTHFVHALINLQFQNRLKPLFLHLIADNCEFWIMQTQLMKPIVGTEYFVLETQYLIKVHVVRSG